MSSKPSKVSAIAVVLGFFGFIYFIDFFVNVSVFLYVDANISQVEN